ncbi:MAG: Asp23/Gls24 family envelope stress response protein [Clostridiales Family XIII bacterium]|jgi:uncharacterized alkaline shock family protein YloU|nr:Asp23/Gls24 family envelope stress response protein [Clostridiales Family XIII bacterium]
MRVYREENALGTVEIDRRVVENLCGRVIDEFEGRLLVSGPKGRLRRGAQKSPEDETGFVRARLKGGRMNIKLYLIFRFGSSVSDLAVALAQKLRGEVPRVTGVEVGLIKMVFVGTLSEKVSKRSLIYIDDGTGVREVRDPEEDDSAND